jgi:AraC-like DNA-binding protein
MPSDVGSVAALAPPDPHGPEPRVNRALDFVGAHFAEGASLVDGSAAAGLNPTHLAAPFRCKSRVTPSSHVNNSRPRQAAHLLRSTDMPTAQVPLEAGLADKRHLTRIVRVRLRKTPNQMLARCWHPDGICRPSPLPYSPSSAGAAHRCLSSPPLERSAQNADRHPELAGMVHSGSGPIESALAARFSLCKETDL